MIASTLNATTLGRTLLNPSHVFIAQELLSCKLGRPLKGRRAAEIPNTLKIGLAIRRAWCNPCP
jgi:hypothetical protein